MLHSIFFYHFSNYFGLCRQQGINMIIFFENDTFFGKTPEPEMIAGNRLTAML